MSKRTNTTPKPEVWQNPNGTFSHAMDHNGEFADETSCRTDLRFAKEWAR